MAISHDVDLLWDFAKLNAEWDTVNWTAASQILAFVPQKQSIFKRLEVGNPSDSATNIT